MDWNIFWSNVGSFFETWQKPIGIVIVIVGAFVVRGVLLFAVRRLVDQVVSGVKKKQNVTDTQALVASPLAAVRIVQRTRTIGTVMTNVINVTVVIVAIILVVTIIDPNIIGSLALLTAALGAGLGFGAQNIVKDVLNGLFMVFEDQLGVGDVVDLGPATGVVEAVGIRITQVRDVNGTLWFVRNGEILRVGNMSQGWSRVIIDLAIPYDSDIDAVEGRMLEVAVAMAAEPKWRSRIIEKPEVWGLESISAEALVIRLVMKTRTSAKDDVARDLRIRLKRALDEMHVTLPSLNTVVLSGFEGAASVKGARPPKTKPIPTSTAATTPPKKSSRSARSAPSTPADPSDPAE
ncbi:mechanosensitive ion channel family protein [Herbiconiux moechotypicola]|uniref:Mechanosensitive ion channel family protein n=1 Tax=Herbiconiux moechotypicola TaxID=637393 RepID=A0ABP5QDF9_9MICO|nr:mechanosensitive ion channel family protein [Herbiconiux moechotypicola]MCS5729810.1 mechanosensitive ion channel family protein [Herbiconiux moechotypicola]